MAEHVHVHDQLIYSVGSQVVLLRDIAAPADQLAGQGAHSRGAVGRVVRAPSDLNHSYSVRFNDASEVAVPHDALMLLALYQERAIGDANVLPAHADLNARVFYRCVIGSRAYGLDDEQSDTDLRGIYLPTAAAQWSLYGVPPQIELTVTQEHYWELQRFLVLALKANPNVLECLYSPLVEKCTTLGTELLAMREIFLSRLIYQTFNGYVLSQFKKLQTDIKNQGQPKPKHVMHLIRLLISGIAVLRHGFVQVRVDEHRAQLLAIKRSELPWAEVDAWRLRLHVEFEQAFAETKLPERPDYERANAFLIRARQAALAEELP